MMRAKAAGWSLCAGLALSVGLACVGAATGGETMAKPGATASLPQLMKNLGGVNKGQIDKREDQDMGFGARGLFLSIYPDANYWITILAVDEQVAAMDISYSGGVSSESWGRLRHALEASGLTAPREKVAGAFGNYTFEDKALLAQLKKSVAAELGAQTPVKVPQSLQSPYQTLTSPLSRLKFGGLCGYAAQKPAGRVAVEALVKAKRIDLLRNVLRSPNPEGRVYAVQALRTLSRKGSPLSAADQATIARVQASPILISACSGCMPESKTAAQLLGNQ